MSIVNAILVAVDSERAVYASALALASLRLSEPELDEASAQDLQTSFRQASDTLLRWDAKTTAVRLACLDRTHAILTKPEHSTAEDYLGKHARKLLQPNGRVSWELSYRLLMANRKPIDQADFDAVKDAIELEGGPSAVEAWNKHVWFTPQFLHTALGELPSPHKMKCKIAFEQQNILSLKIDVLNQLNKPVFDSLVKINVETATVEEKRYYLSDEKMRGSGFVKPLLRGLHNIYKNLGIRTLKTSAELENGAYVWARAGYLPTATSWRKLSERLSKRLEALQDELAPADKIKEPYYGTLKSALASSNPRNIWLIADTVLPVKGQKLGYYLLAGTSWKGYLNLDDPKQMERCTLFLTPSSSPTIEAHPIIRSQALHGPN